MHSIRYFEIDAIMNGEMLTADQVAEMSGRPSREVRAAARRGDLDGIEAGSELWFARRAVYEWLARESERDEELTSE